MDEEETDKGRKERSERRPVCLQYLNTFPLSFYYTHIELERKKLTLLPLLFFFYSTMKTHPGSVVHLSDNPLDSNKVSIIHGRSRFANFCDFN
jgi:hypothetical protein